MHYFALPFEELLCETYLSPWLRWGLLRRLAEPHLSQVRAWHTLVSRTYFIDGKGFWIAIEAKPSFSGLPAPACEKNTPPGSFIGVTVSTADS